MTANEFKDACSELGFSYREMADRLRVSAATIGNWANGKSNIRHTAKWMVQELLEEHRKSKILSDEQKITNLKDAAQKIGDVFKTSKKIQPSNNEKLLTVYNYDLLMQYPSAQVLIFDDEKSADLLNAELAPHNCIAIVLPTNLAEIRKIDLEPLKHRKCTCIPAFTKPRRNEKSNALLANQILDFNVIDNPAKMISFFIFKGYVFDELYESSFSLEALHTHTDITPSRLLRLRTALRLTQQKLSKQLGISQSAINRYENGDTSINANALTKYANRFDVSADYILGRCDSPQGKLYDFSPRIEDNDDMRLFIEMCFDPNSPMSGKLKDTLLKMMKGG